MSIFQEKRRCQGQCGEMKPYGEMNGYQVCNACASAQEAANRAKSGLKSDFGPEADAAVKAAIALFPATFQLRGHAGTFRFNQRNSFVSRGVIYLYTDIQRGESWSDFVKGTVEEFQRQVVR